MAKKPSGRMSIAKVGLQMIDLGKAASSFPTSNIMDPFENSYGSESDLAVIRPPYDPYRLAMIPEYSEILGQCIRAYSTNVHGFGWQLVRAAHIKDAEELPKDAIDEKRQLQALFDSINGNYQNLTLVCGDKRHDLETTGMGYIEIVRDRAGQIAEMYHLPSHTMRMTRLDKDLTKFEQPYRDEEGQFQMRPRIRRFRRYVQIVNSRKMFFKEFGDPREISSATGKAVGKSDRPANEVLVFRLRCNHSPYGVPRWIGSLIGVLGSRKADEINYDAFEHKMIPPLVILVSGGKMAEECTTKLKEVFEHEIKGSGNFHKALILEAIGTDIGDFPGEKQSTVRIDIKPLTQFIKDDGLFMNYQDKKARKVASTMLLPPIYIGLSDDYNRATAMEAARVTEEQVFVPERRDFCYLFNSTVMADLRINNWSLDLVAPKTTDLATILTSIAGVKEAIPVDVLQEVVAEIRGKAIGEIDERFKGVPLGLLYSGASFDTSTVDETVKVIRKFLDVRAEVVKHLSEDEPE